MRATERPRNPLAPFGSLTKEWRAASVRIWAPASGACDEQETLRSCLKSNFWTEKPEVDLTERSPQRFMTGAQLWFGFSENTFPPSGGPVFRLPALIPAKNGGDAFRSCVAMLPDPPPPPQGRRACAPRVTEMCPPPRGAGWSEPGDTRWGLHPPNHTDPRTE